jgi:3-keto-disaccharide hydrolase
MGRVRKSSNAAALLLAASFVVATCNACAQPSASPRNTPEVSPVADGWIDLFDGSSTAALRGYGQDSFPASWVVEGGELRAVPGTGVDLITRDAFTDFELEFEWRLGEAGNSGVIYRVVESDAPSWASGPEYQLLDDAGHPDGRDPLTSAASLFGLIAPDAVKRLEPVGRFNTGRIVIHDGHVEHWLNDRLVLGYDWAGPDVRSLTAASKFRDTPAFMSADAGAIVLQHHGEEVWFRKVRIRRLT